MKLAGEKSRRNEAGEDTRAYYQSVYILSFITDAIGLS